MMRKIGAFCLLWSLMSTGWCDASAQQQLKMKLIGLHSFKAHFTQYISGKRGKNVSSGSMAFVRPNHFYWETLSPNHQKIIADGRKIWIYDIPLEQISVRKQSRGLSGTAGLFLTGYSDAMMRQFNTTVSQHGKIITYHLQPKNKNKQVSQITISFQGSTPVSMEARDALGRTSHIHFSNTQINPVINNQLFQIRAPKNVDVIWQ